MLAIAVGPPAYYRSRYGLQGLGDALDPAKDFNCGSDGKYYVCRPKTTAVTQQVMAMQLAIDAFLVKLPLFRASEIPITANPIGSSKSGYDGRVGPVTSGVGEVAIIGAAEMLRAAGEGDPPGDVIIAMRDYTVEKTRTENFARFSPAIASFLKEVTARFDELMGKIQVRRAVADQPIFVAPPPIPVPADIAKDVKKKGVSTGWLIGGGVAAAGLLGLLGLGLRDADKKDDKKVHWQGKKSSSAASFMGARTKSKRRRRR